MSGGATTTYTPTWDADGNLLTNGLGTTNTYGQNSVQNKLTQQVTSGVTTTYAYNGDGDRVGVTTGATTTNFLWFKQGATDRMFWGEALPQVLEEDTGATGATPTSIRTDIYGLRLVANAGLNPAGGFGSTTDRLFYHYDGQNNVRSLADWSGAILNTYSYDAWGNVRASTGSTANAYGYDGQQQDASGLYYLRARYYDPVSGRFAQQDPAHSGRNWYVYAGNSPVNATDPCGLWCRISFSGWDWITVHLDWWSEHVLSHLYFWLNIVLWIGVWKAGSSWWAVYFIIAAIFAGYTNSLIDSNYDTAKGGGLDIHIPFLLNVGLGLIVAGILTFANMGWLAWAFAFANVGIAFIGDAGNAHAGWTRAPGLIPLLAIACFTNDWAFGLFPPS